MSPPPLPSTLDAAPAAPTLTLDPAADEKVIEESKKATPMQVEDTPLSPEEQKMVNDFAEKIDITNSQMVLQYGAASQKKLSDFSETALSRVKTKDMGETGELITSLISELQALMPVPSSPRASSVSLKRPPTASSSSRPATTAPTRMLSASRPSWRIIRSP